MARRAVESFHESTWPNTELVVVDDLDDPSFPRHDEGLDGATYLSLKHTTVGEKRNLACALAHGVYIVHFDSDDISSPRRIAHQIDTLEASGKSVTGYHAMLAHEDRPMRVVTETYMPRRNPTDQSGRSKPMSQWFRWQGPHDYAPGLTQCYRRDWWRRHPFPAIQNSEDDAFWAEALAAGEAVAVDGEEYVVASNHSGNSSCRFSIGPQWTELPCDPRLVHV
jgi:hypothetical protein